ncbi:MAG: PEP-CTERM sorting domain-containing protein [Planctomycetota bacterium]|nr:PEP-CTERM sorting domain-containing protein [Planctomycetota bacterium]
MLRSTSRQCARSVVIIAWCVGAQLAGAALGATSVVTAPGDIDPPAGFFTGVPIVVDFDAARADGGIPPEVRLVSGIVESTEYPDGHVSGLQDYAQNSPVSDVWAVANTGVIFDFIGPVAPKEVGVVFTDAVATGWDVTFEAWSGFGATGTRLGDVTAFRGNDGTNWANFADDCFFGIKDAGDIRSIRLWCDSPGDGIELDVLRVDALPEPATLALVALGGLGQVFRRRRK